MEIFGNRRQDNVYAGRLMVRTDVTIIEASRFLYNQDITIIDGYQDVEDCGGGGAVIIYADGVLVDRLLDLLEDDGLAFVDVDDSRLDVVVPAGLVEGDVRGERHDAAGESQGELGRGY